MNDLSFRHGCQVNQVNRQVHIPDRFQFMLSDNISLKGVSSEFFGDVGCMDELWS